MTSLRERFAGFFRRYTGSKDVYKTISTSDIVGDLSETVVFDDETTLTFWDVRDSEKAKRFEVEPGYYIEVHNVSNRDIKNPDILHKYLIQLNTLVWNKVPSPRKESEVKLKNPVYIDINRAWIFNPYAYNPEKKALLIRAIKVVSENN